MRNKYNKFIRNVLDKVKNVDSESSLDFVNDYLEKASLEDIIENKNMGNLYKKLNNKMKVLNKYKNNFQHQEIIESDVKETAKILATIKSWFKEGINETDFKKILAFLLILGYFKIPFQQIIDPSLIDKEKIQEIIKKINKILNEFKININTNENTPYHERKYFEEFEQGIESSNIRQVYDLIEAIERGRGFIRNKIIVQLVKLSIFLDQEKFIDLLSNKDNIEYYIYFLANLRKEELLKIGSHKLVDNEWLLFEIIRQVLGRKRDSHLTASAVNQLAQILQKIAIADRDFFQQTVRYYNSYADFSKALGTTLGKLSRQYIDDYLETIQFDIYHHNLENNRLFMEHYDLQVSEEKLYYLVEKIHDKWISFLDQIASKDFYISGIIYTDYFHSIYHYYYLLAENDEFIINKIENAVDAIKKENYYWKESILQERVYFYIFLTKIYIYSLITKEKGFSLNDEVLIEIKDYLNDQRIWLQWFDSIDIPEKINIIFNNFNKISDK